MSLSSVATPIDETLAVIGGGRFIPTFRNRVIGEEVVEGTPTVAGGLELRAETVLAARGYSLRQSVTALFDIDLRPQWCRVIANTGSCDMKLSLEIAGGQAVIRAARGGESRCATCRLTGEPLLLVDNCFSAHALAALVAARGAGGPRTYLAVPAFEDLRAAVPGAAPVDLGGDRFERPTVTLHLTPELEEHAWIDGPWVTRLAVPRALIRVDWKRR